MGNYTDDPKPPESLTTYALNPIWGGTETKNETDYYWFDHTHVSTGTVTSSSPWPNEPAGYTTVTDQRWDSLSSDGWGVAWNDSDYVSIAQDPTGPLSPANVVQFFWPNGETGSHGVGAPFHYLGPNGAWRVYVGLWWKPSDPWQGHSSNVNKIQYISLNSGGSIFMAMYGSPGGPYELRVFPQFAGISLDRWLTPNINNVAVTIGQWHRLEWLVDYSGTLGHIQWWMDGVLIGDWADDPPPTTPLVEYLLDPVWGGTGDAKTESDYYWFDHTHISTN